MAAGTCSGGWNLAPELLWVLCVSAEISSALLDPGGEKLVRKEAREGGGGKVEGTCPPSHSNELPGLAFPGQSPAHSSWHLRSSSRDRGAEHWEVKGVGPHLQAPGP